MLGRLTDVQAEQLLRTATIGRIGCHAHGRTYVAPIRYAYRDGCVYAHSGPSRKIDIMRSNPAVWFEVEQADGPAVRRSVIAEGRFEQLDGARAAAAEQLLADGIRRPTAGGTVRPGNGTAPDAAVRSGPAHPPIVYRIRLTAITGRSETR